MKKFLLEALQYVFAVYFCSAFILLIAYGILNLGYSISTNITERLFYCSDMKQLSILQRFTIYVMRCIFTVAFVGLLYLIFLLMNKIFR